MTVSYWSRLLCCFAVWVVGGCSPSPHYVSSGSGGYEELEVSIAELKNWYVSGATPIIEAATIRGVVTANDSYGEYPNVLIVEDETGAIEMSVDIDYGDIVEYFKIGYEVSIDCSGLYLGSRGGTIVLGCEPTEDSVVDCIETADLLRRCEVVGDVGLYEPQCVAIDDLNTSLVSCYLQLSRLMFVVQSGVESFCMRSEETGRYTSTIHTLEDESGNQIDLYVPYTTLYAGEALPSGWGDIYVTLSYYAGRYSVRLVARRFYFDGLE